MFASTLNQLSRFFVRKHDEAVAKKDLKKDLKKEKFVMTPCLMLVFKSIEKKYDDENKSIVIIQRYMQDSTILNQFGEPGENLLYCACRWGRFKVAWFLIQNGLDVKQVTKLGSVLHALLEAHQCERITTQQWRRFTREMCELGCDINAGNASAMPPFLCAVQTGCMPVIQHLVDLGCDYNVTDAADNHALHLAVKLDRPSAVDLVQYLVTLPGINFNIANKDGCVPAEAVEILCCWEACVKRKNFNLLLRHEYQLAVYETLLSAGGRYGRFVFDDMLQALKKCYHATIVALENLDDASPATSSDVAHNRAWQPFKFLCQWLCVACTYSVAQRGDQQQQQQSSQRQADAVADIVTLTSDHPVLMNYVTQLFGNATTNSVVLSQRPMKLTMLCRRTIRVTLATHGNLFASNHLPLPRRMRDFIDLTVTV